jgi:hypothetical protein
MMRANSYATWAEIRSREMLLRLGLAVAAAGLGFVLTRSLDMWAWLAAVVVTQLIDARILAACVRREDGPMAPWRVAYGLSTFLTSLAFSSLGLLVLVRGDAHAAAFAVLLISGAR